MTAWQAILLGILQGLAEFLPISSSGHLVIVPHLLDWPDPGLTMDTMLHMGTLAAILVYFWRGSLDIWRLLPQTASSASPWRTPTRASPGIWSWAPSPAQWPVCCSRISSSVSSATRWPPQASCWAPPSSWPSARSPTRAHARSHRSRGPTAWPSAWPRCWPSSLVSAGRVPPSPRDAIGFPSGGRRPLQLPSRRAHHGRHGDLSVAQAGIGCRREPPHGIVLLGVAAAAGSGYLAIAGLLTLVRRRGFIGFRRLLCALRHTGPHWRAGIGSALAPNPTAAPVGRRPRRAAPGRLRAHRRPGAHADTPTSAPRRGRAAGHRRRQSVHLPFALLPPPTKGTTPRSRSLCSRGPAA